MSYIEREAVNALIKAECSPKVAAYLIDAVATIPAADVRPVVRAHWYWDKDGMDWNIGAWRCSACHSRPETWWQGDSNSPRNKSGHYYCPNCGADMRGEES